MYQLAENVPIGRHRAGAASISYRFLLFTSTLEAADMYFYYWVALNTNCFMRSFLIVLILFSSLSGLSQNFVLPSGEYMDTTSIYNPTCREIGLVRYYSVDGKYPRSSTTLLKEVQAHLHRKNQVYTGSGYVTFRFVIDCTGQRHPQVQVLQTNAAYQRFHFSKDLVNELYSFFTTLTEWRTARSPNGQESLNYLAYMTFRIKDGKVVAVSP